MILQALFAVMQIAGLVCLLIAWNRRRDKAIHVDVGTFEEPTLDMTEEVPMPPPQRVLFVARGPREIQ